MRAKIGIVISGQILVFFITEISVKRGRSLSLETTDDIIVFSFSVGDESLGRIDKKLVLIDCVLAGSSCYRLTSRYRSIRENIEK